MLHSRQIKKVFWRWYHWKIYNNSYLITNEQKLLFNKSNSRPKPIINVQTITRIPRGRGRGRISSNIPKIKTIKVKKEQKSSLNIKQLKKKLKKIQKKI